MIEKKYYLKYPLGYSYLVEFLRTHRKEKLNIFIDLNSICRGFFKAETILFEVAEYGERGDVSGQLLKELREYLNHLFSVFKEFDPYFVIFYDNGRCLQNRSIMSTYKAGRSSHSVVVDGDDRTTEIYRQIRRLYYHQIKEKFTKEDLSFVFYSREYETDLVPYYCLKNNLFDSAESNVQNFVLSVDKDLLQCCRYPNVLQLITSFKPNHQKGKYEIDFGVYDDASALRYIYPKFQPGILSAKHIPIVLSIAGDKSDEILGLSGVGVSKAVRLVEKNGIPHDLDGLRRELTNLPKIIQDNINIIIRNFKLISFEEQIKRLPREFMSEE